MFRMPYPLVFAALLAAPAVAQEATFESRSLTPAAALKAASAALADCSKRGYQVGVAVTDRAGHALVMLRDRYAGPHTVQTSMDKAYTAISFKMDTLEFAKVTEEGEASGIRHLPRVIALGGGLPIESQGSVVGAIGISGAPGGDLDKACAQAGIAAIRDELEF